MRKENLKEVAGKISEEHRKNMIIGFAGLVENLARNKRVPLLTFDDIQFTRSCQVFLHPRGYQNMVTIAGRDTPLPRPLPEHPDASIQPNFSLVYVGWIIDFLEFGQYPFKLPDGMRMPQKENVAGQFSQSMYQALCKIYTPNSGYSSR